MSAQWNINPVTLKELRQMVRSRFVSVGLIAYLVAQLVGVSFTLMAAGGSRSPSGLYALGLGRNVFLTVFFLLAVILLLGIPIFVGTRMGLERGKEQVDLQFITALRPRQFVDGKVASTLVLMLVCASAALPFLALSYLLRGIDMFWILWLFGWLLIVATCCLYGTLFLGAIGATRVLRGFLLLGVSSGLLAMLSGVMAGSAGMVTLGAGELFSSRAAVLAWGTALALLVCACALLRAAGVAALSPPHANRALPLRIWFTAAWLFWGGVSVAWGVHERASYPVAPWATISCLFAYAMMAISASLPPGLSRRVQTAVSAGRGKRLLQFVFFSGAECGMVWACLLGFATLAVLSVMAALFPKKEGNDLLIHLRLWAAFLYGLASVLSMRALWGAVSSHVKLSCKLVGVLAFLLSSLGCCLPYLLTMENGGRTAFFVGNIVAAVGEDQESLSFHIVCSFVWAILAFVAWSPLLFRAFEAFGAGVKAQPAGKEGA